jgi:hypothetical protein
MKQQFPPEVYRHFPPGSRLYLVVRKVRDNSRDCDIYQRIADSLTLVCATKLVAKYFRFQLTPKEELRFKGANYSVSHHVEEYINDWLGYEGESQITVQCL